jgi:hypothetical protein
MIMPASVQAAPCLIANTQTDKHASGLVCLPAVMLANLLASHFVASKRFPFCVREALI